MGVAKETKFGTKVS